MQLQCIVQQFFVALLWSFHWEYCIQNTRIFNFDVIFCSLKSIRSDLVQGCKAPNGMGQACLITSSESGLAPMNLVCTPYGWASGMRTHDRTNGPIVKLLYTIIFTRSTEMWGAVTNSGYDGMPTSLAIVRILIHGLGQGSMADKPSTSMSYSS